MSSKRKALSALVATIIIVSISIVVSIAAAYRFSEVTGQYFKVEKMEIVSKNCSYADDLWIVTIEIRNTGTNPLVLKSVFLNSLEVNSYDTASPGQGKASTDIPVEGLELSSGESATMHVYIDGPEGSGSYGSLSKGTTIRITLHSATGMDYQFFIELAG